MIFLSQDVLVFSVEWKLHMQWRTIDCWQNCFQRSYQEYHVEIQMNIKVSYVILSEWVHIRKKRNLSFLSCTSLCSDCIKFTTWQYLMKECTILYQRFFHQWYRIDLATENRDDWCSCSSKSLCYLSWMEFTYGEE